VIMKVVCCLFVCSETGVSNKWDDVIYPGMKACVINTLIATQERSETRKVRLHIHFSSSN